MEDWQILLIQILEISNYSILLDNSKVTMLEAKIKAEGEYSASTIWPFVAAICIGLSDTISKGYINRSNDFSFLLSLGIVQVPVAIAYLRIEKQSISRSMSGVIKKFNDYKYALIGRLFNIIGTGFLWLSFSLHTSFDSITDYS